MSVILELEPKIEDRARSNAKSLGKSLEHYIVEVLEEKVSGGMEKSHFYDTATNEEWEAALDSLGQFSHPVPATCDDSRESIYGPREDAQL